MLLMAANHNAILIPSRIRLTEQLLSTSDIQPSKYLADLPPNARISLVVDGWTSPSHHAFVGITAHAISKSWRLSKTLLGFEPLDESHSGVALARIVFGVLQKFHLLDRFMCITTDNASNNTVMAVTLRAELAKAGATSDYNDPELKEKLGVVQHLPCLAHVLQLVLGALLKFAKANPVNDEVQNTWTVGEEVIQEAPGIPVTLAKVCSNSS